MTFYWQTPAQGPCPINFHCPTCGAHPGYMCVDTWSRSAMHGYHDTRTR